MHFYWCYILYTWTAIGTNENVEYACFLRFDIVQDVPTIHAAVKLTISRLFELLPHQYTLPGTAIQLNRAVRKSQILHVQICCTGHLRY